MSWRPGVIWWLAANEGAALNATEFATKVKFEFFGDDGAMAEMVRHVDAIARPLMGRRSLKWNQT